MSSPSTCWNPQMCKKTTTKKKRKILLNLQTLKVQKSFYQHFRKRSDAGEPETAPSVRQVMQCRCVQPAARLRPLEVTEKNKLVTITEIKPKVAALPIPN